MINTWPYTNPWAPDAHPTSRRNTNQYLVPANVIYHRAAFMIDVQDLGGYGVESMG
jgi:hypothetical protein